MTQFAGQSPQSVLRGLTHTDPQIRYEAVREVADRGVGGEPFTDRLILMVQHDPEGCVRTRAVEALGQIARAGVRVLDRLANSKRRAIYPETARLAYITERVECSLRNGS